jgi:hypothetical protein
MNETEYKKNLRVERLNFFSSNIFSETYSLDLYGGEPADDFFLFAPESARRRGLSGLRANRIFS